jgi:two-component system sensor histidine kinase YesM
MSVSLRVKLTVIFILFATVSGFTMTALIMRLYTEDMLQAVSQNVHSIVVRNNELISSMLNRVEYTSYNLLTNKQCYDAVKNLSSQSISERMRREQELTYEVDRHMGALNSVYQVLVYSPYWLFGREPNQINLNNNQIRASGLLEKSAGSSGMCRWVSGFDYGELFASEYYAGKDDYEYHYPIIMLRTMNFQYTYNGVRNILPSDEEAPVMLTFLLEEELRDLYAGSVSYAGAETFLVNEEGRILSSDSERLGIATTVPDEVAALQSRSGYTRSSFQNSDSLLCYDTIESTGWLTVTVVPIRSLLGDALRESAWYLSWLAVLVLAMSVFVAAMISRSITKPITSLVKAVKRVGTGDFSADVPIPRKGEFRVLAENFNHMEKEIAALIEENYEITLREKNTQLMALSLQMNPHFLYNALNTINMLALENGDEKTSDLILSLSTMLQYSLKNPQEKVSLIYEIIWTREYLRIMQARFWELFDYSIEAANELYDYKVPKFFLQPFVENSIKHGFANRSQGGVIIIGISMRDEKLQIEIADNGIGMDWESVQKNVFRAAEDKGIGLSNIHRRLTLIYGADYKVWVDSQPGSGAVFHLSIPCER